MKKIITFIAITIVTVAFGQTTVTKQFLEFNFPNAASGLEGNIDNNISFYTQKNGSSTSPRYYTSGAAIRLYQGAGNGGAIHFIFDNAIIVTDVTINALTNYSPTAIYTLDGAAGVEIIAVNNDYVISNIEAVSSFSIKNATLDNTQIRITGVTITYIIEEDLLSPFLNTSVSSINNLDYLEFNGPSVANNFNILGFSLDDSDVTITAPENFEVSLDNEVFESVLNLEAYDGTVRTIYVHLVAGLDVNTYSGNVAINGGGVTSPVHIAVSGEVTSEMVEIESELTTNFTNVINLDYVTDQGPSETQIFVLTGTGLDDSDVTITAPENFEVSLDNEMFESVLNLEAYDGMAKNIYVHLVAGLDVNTYSGNVAINGGGVASPVHIEVSGEVTSGTVSINDNSIEGLRIYPNPTSGLINIVSDVIGSKDVKIFNALGQYVLEVITEEAIDVSVLKAGVYIVKITQDGKKATRKLIVK